MVLTLNDIQGKNLVSTVEALIPKKGKTKDGMEYDYLDLVFKNGWTKRVFVGSDGVFGVLNAAELLKSESLGGSQASLEEKSNLPF